jgi:dihydropteroate synthase
MALIKGGRPLVMGIVNVTPDSFSDGGLFFSPEKALAQALKLIEEGADIIDIGGVSTAPGRKIVSLELEYERVIPVVKALAQKTKISISVDTFRAPVAHDALLSGASWINDQSAGLFDSEMPKVMKKAEAVVIMHHKTGDSGVDAGEAVHYQDPVKEVLDFFSERKAALIAEGLKEERIIVDPGFGFGKGLNDSLLLLKHFASFSHKSFCLAGLSRKSFLGKLCNIKKPQDRDFVSLAASLIAVQNGADIIRCHNVRAVVDGLKVYNSIRETR